MIKEILDTYPLTPLQEGIFFHAELSRLDYLEQSSFRIDGEFHIEHLRNTLQYLIRRHAILRTSFYREDVDFPVQVVFKEREADFQFYDITDTQNGDSFVNDFKRRDREKGFDFTDGSLLRLAVIKTGSACFELIWTYHHILLDGWSGSLLVSEFFYVYNCLTLNKSINLAEAKGFGEYVRWLQKQNNNEAKKYWMEYLNGHVEHLSIDNRNISKPYHQGIQSFTLDPSARSFFESFARENNVTTHHVFQAIWAVLVSRYTNRNEVIFGEVVSTRPSEISGIDGIMGIFLNTIPVRVAVANHENLAQLVQAIRQQASASTQYNYFSLAEMQALGSVNKALFDHILITENYPEATGTGDAGTPFNIVSSEKSQKTNYDLNVFLYNKKDIVIKLEYNANRYEDEFIKNVIKHFVHLTAQLAKNRNIKLRAIQILPPEDIFRLISEFNFENEFAFNSNTLLERFRTCVQTAPHRIAINFTDQWISYSQLAAMVNNLKIAIQTRVSEEEIIGVYMDRSPWNIIAVLACYNARCCYLPLEKELGLHKLQTIIDDAQPALIITDRGYDNLFAGFSVLNIEDLPQTPDADVVGPVNDSTFNSCIIYTSGSTGKPKGVVQTSRTITNLVAWQIDFSGIGRGSAFLQICSFGFDVFVQDTFFTLCSGRTLLLTPGEIKSNLQELYLLITSQKPEMASFPFSILNFFFLELSDVELSKLGIEQYITYGEQLILNANLKKCLQERSTVSVFNHYGPMETFIVSNYVVGQKFGNIVDHAPIGRPIDNNSIFVLHENHTLAPVGVQGEIYASGANIAAGYLNRAELTAEKFIKIRFPDGQTRLCYKTGDFGYWSATGNLIYTGRMDRQVKMNGLRVELDDIEYHLKQYPGVRDAVVEITVINGDKKITAFLTVAFKVTPTALREYLNERVPVNTLPIYFYTIDQFKLNKNGKIDRSFLQKMAADQLTTEHRNDTLTSVEKEISEIWQSVLGTKGFTTLDNFFHIGGHSLKAMQVIGRISKRMKARISIKDFYANSTIKNLAALISKSPVTGSTDLVPIEDQYYYTASASQKRIWLADMHSVSNATYLLSSDFTLEKFDDRIFRYTVKKLVEQNEILRTGFFEFDGDLRQRVIQADEATIDIMYSETNADLSPSHSGFQLDRPCLFRIIVTHSGREITHCKLVIHHIICDALSINVMITKFLSLYSAYLEQESKSNSYKLLSPPAGTLQYKDISAWHNSLLPFLSEAKLFWRTQPFETTSLLTLPRSTNAAVSAGSGKTYSSGLPKKDVVLLSKQCNVTCFATIFASISILLYRLTNLNTFVVGVPVSGRTMKEQEDQLGVFINLLPVLVKLDTRTSFQDYLNDAARKLTECMEHQLYPFDQILKDLNIKWRAGEKPLFNVIVTFENLEEWQMSDNQRSVLQKHCRADSIKYDLNFVVKHFKDDLILSVEYDTSLFTPDFIEKSVGYLRNILAGTCLNPQQSVNSIRYVSAADLNNIRLFNETAYPFPQDSSLVTLFTNIAASQPDHIAVQYNDSCITYKELDVLSGKLADLLRREIPIDQNNIIGILMTPGVEMLVTIIGILKSGGAYMPLDIMAPDIRIEYILSDACPALVLTNVEQSEKKFNYATKIVDHKFWAELRQVPTRAAQAKIDPGHAAYVLYTSGSTGRPKGVVMEHAGVVNRLDWMWRQLSFDKSDVILQKTPYTFDVSVWELLMTVCFGARLVVVSREIVFDALQLKKAIQQYGVTTVHFVPSMFNLFLDSVNDNDDALESINRIICSGEPLYPETAKRSFQKTPAKLYNLYGPTEAAIDVTYHQVNVSDETIPIGKPIANVKMHVLDSDLQIVPVGIEGHIFIEGVCLARGYLNNPELTHERFVQSPANDVRIYDTGDIGKWDSHGNIEYIGRADTQVKISGVRIEPGEIENVLLETKLLHSAAVVVAEGKTGKKLVCFYCSHSTLNNETLTTFLHQRLPAGMVPSDFVHISAMPLTLSGKTDRKSLVNLYHDKYNENISQIEPRTPIERELHAIWKSLLGLDAIGVDDEFLQLGGNSLIAMRMIPKIKEMLGVDIGFREIFTNSSIAQLAGLIGDKINQDVVANVNN